LKDATVDLQNRVAAATTTSLGSVYVLVLVVVATGLQNAVAAATTTTLRQISPRPLNPS
jgi:hypothetical protein